MYSQKRGFLEEHSGWGPFAGNPIGSSNRKAPPGRSTRKRVFLLDAKFLHRQKSIRDVLTNRVYCGVQNYCVLGFIICELFTVVALQGRGRLGNICRSFGELTVEQTLTARALEQQIRAQNFRINSGSNHVQ